MGARQHVLEPGSQLVGLGGQVGHGGASTMDQLLAQVPIAALADPQQLCLAAGGVLPRCQAEPGRQIPPLGEGAAVSDGCQQRGGVDDADAGNGRQPPRLSVLTGQRHKFVVIGLDPSVEGRPFVAEIFEQLRCARTDGRIASHEFPEPAHQVDAAFRQDNAALEQYRPELIA